MPSPKAIKHPHLPLTHVPTIILRLLPFLNHLVFLILDHQHEAAAGQGHLHHCLNADVARHTAHEHQQAAQALQRYSRCLPHLEVADGGGQVCNGTRCTSDAKL